MVETREHELENMDLVVNKIGEFNNGQTQLV